MLEFLFTSIHADAGYHSIHIILVIGTVERIYIGNNQAAIKGSSIQLVCDISQFSSQDTVNLYKTDSSVLSGPLPVPISVCYVSVCLTNTVGRYTFSADNTNVYINITNLNRSEDQKYWTCVIDTQRKDIYLTIYTVPQSLQFDSPPSQDQDLAQKAVTFRCSTGCAYPQPSFSWFYNETGGSRQEWSTSASVTNTAGGCTDSEIMYTSTLSLARYTTFTANVEKTVQFTCGITSFTGMTQPLYTNPSVNVQFAVRVTSAALKDSNSAPSEPLQVTAGVSKTLTCTTSVSRPTATVVWYIGTVEKQRSSSITSFTFTPQNSDHNKQIFCKAFNMQPESEAVSSNKITLYVHDPASIRSFYIDGHLGQRYVTVDEHQAEIQFKCVVDSKSAATIKILFDDGVLKEQIHETSLSFVRHDIACFDAGLYTCEGSNGYGRESRENITLFVNCSPRPFRHIQRNITSDLHILITLSFTAIAYPEPGPKGFTWHKKDGVGWLPLLSNADLMVSSSSLQSNLTLMNVSKEDFGIYRVTVTNDIGTYEKRWFLSENGQQHTDTANCRKENTALIVGVILGVVCVVTSVYAAYLTILHKRNTINKGTCSTDKSSKPATYVNQNFTTDVTESQEYEGVQTGAEETSDQQYTDLSRNENTDKDTYDIIKKM